MKRRHFPLAWLAMGLATNAAHAQSRPPLEIGVLPNISARVLLAQYQPMREYLERELTRVVQISTAPDWSSFHQRTLAAEYDLLITAAHLARLAQLDRGYRPLATYTPRIRGLVIVAKDKPLASATALAGQVVVLSNPQSLVTLRAMQWLTEQGLQRDRDFKTVRTSTDDSVGTVLLRGDARAAIVSAGEFRAIPEGMRAQLAVHTTFAEVAGFVLMASPKLAADDTQALRRALLAFGSSTEGKAFLSATGFTGVTELEAGTLEAMDAYADATRRLL